MLSEYLKTLKNQRNLTNAQIAQLSGVSESTISRLLKGENKSVDLATAMDVVRALGGSMDDAMRGQNSGHSCTDARNSCTDASHSCTQCPRFAAMQDEFNEMYIEEIRRDIIETTNQRMAEVYRVNDKRVEDEKAHCDMLLAQSKAYYEQLAADKDAIHQQRIENLMRIVDARAKTINRLSLISGAMAVCLIALLVLNIFFPTNPILKW